MFAAYCRLDVSLAQSNRDVVRACYQKLAKHCQRDASYRRARHEYYRGMLQEHDDAVALYEKVVLGQL